MPALWSQLTSTPGSDASLCFASCVPPYQTPRGTSVKIIDHI